MEEPLVEKGAVAETLIGKCRARLMSARAVIDAALEVLRSIRRRFSATDRTARIVPRPAR